MSKPLLISEAQLKEKSNIEKNVDGKLLSRIINDVQELDLRPILGDALYEQVIEEFTAAASTTSPVPLEADTKSLIVDYIHPYLVNAVMVRFIVFNNYKLTSAGVLKMNATLSDNATPKEVEYAKNYYEGQMASYKNKLVKYLRASDLLDGTQDTGASFGATGWFIDTGGGNGFFSPTSASRRPCAGVSSGWSYTETDPIWTAEKVNYYLKSEIYTKTEVDSKLAEFGEVKVVVPLSPGINTAFTFDSTLYKSATIAYVLFDENKVNMRAGELKFLCNGLEVVHYEESPRDIGDTDPIEIRSEMGTGTFDFKLYFVPDSTWTVEFKASIL